jgi:hypothetical protein
VVVGAPAPPPQAEEVGQQVKFHKKPIYNDLPKYFNGKPAESFTAAQIRIHSRVVALTMSSVQWATTKHYERMTQQYQHDDSYRWWLDRFTESASYEVWNRVFEVTRAGQYGSNDREAEKKANAAKQQFDAAVV